MSENPKQKEERKKRDKEIIALWPTLTLEEIAVRYGLTRQRIEQVLKKYGKK